MFENIASHWSEILEGGNWKAKVSKIILFADDLSEVFLYAKKTVVQEDEISDPVVEISEEEALIDVLRL